MTSDDDQRPPSRRPRQQGEDATPPDSPAPPPADQGELWSDQPSEPPQEPSLDDGLDDFIADLPPPEEEPVPATAPATSRQPVSQPPVYDRYDDHGEAEYSMLSNPYVLAALAVAAAIILAVAFVLIFGEDDRGGSLGFVSATSTPLPGQFPGVQAEVIAKAAIREGPGLDFFELGLLTNGQDVSVVGRNDDSSWYQIVFPGTELRGWVPDSALRLPDGADGAIEVVLFTPIPKPSVEQPTPTPPPATATEEAFGPPDIAVEVLDNVCPDSGPINLVLRNVGDVDISGRQIVVTVSTPEGVVSEQTLVVNNLDVGDIVAVNTGVEVQPPRTTVAVVFANEPQDTDPSNNIITCVVAGEGGGLSSPAVPPPAETPAGN